GLTLVVVGLSLSPYWLFGPGGRFPVMDLEEGLKVRRRALDRQCADCEFERASGILGAADAARVRRQLVAEHRALEQRIKKYARRAAVNPSGLPPKIARDRACAECGVPCYAGSRFCAECGAPLASRRHRTKAVDPQVLQAIREKIVTM
ncbi:MAG: zinc ribbon domain-containing protein, partial [Deltaproteobacteria bacterium]|nr:zinc ribbon domain-containing protein [Deltaproteobacteria bacterium]